MKAPINTWFRMFAWAPVTVVGISHEDDPSTGQSVPVGSVDTVWMKPVYCKVVKNMRSPLPTVEYITVAQFRDMWVKEFALLLRKSGVQPLEENALNGAVELSSNYQTSPTDFFIRTFGQTPEEHWQDQLLDLIRVHAGIAATTSSPVFLNIVSVTGGYGSLLLDSNVGDFIAQAYEESESVPEIHTSEIKGSEDDDETSSDNS